VGKLTHQIKERKMEEAKIIFIEELKVSFSNLKAKGEKISKEALELVAKELSDMFARIVVRTENKLDDFFLAVKPLIDREIEKISE